jgi:hypothetical protein
MSLWSYTDNWLPEITSSIPWPKSASNEIQIVVEQYMENPYPYQPDDGTWEGEGGFVAKPDHKAYVLDDMFSYGKKVILHPLTYAELEYALEKKSK